MRILKVDTHLLHTVELIESGKHYVISKNNYLPRSRKGHNYGCYRIDNIVFDGIGDTTHINIDWSKSKIDGILKQVFGFIPKTIYF